MNCDESQKEGDTAEFDLPTTLETLGDHLHAQITSYFPRLNDETVSKVTGVLLECGQKDILTMLQDFQILQKRVTKVLPILNPPKPTEAENIPISSDVNVLFDWTDNDSEELFDKVAAIDPIFCAKITGMLLEKKPSFLRQCLTNSDLLNSVVEKARTTYLKSLEITSVSSLLETADNEAVVEEEEEGQKVLISKTRVGTLDNHLNELGNSIFSQVVMWYPKLADKITGMLLEMNIEELESVVNDSALLKNQADKSFLALKNSGYLTADYQVKEKISLSYR